MVEKKNQQSRPWVKSAVENVEKPILPLIKKENPVDPGWTNGALR
jgi:hypothetical protein